MGESMKITVEMTPEEFEEFQNYRKEKAIMQKQYEQLRRNAYKLREAVFDAIEYDEKKGTAKIVGVDEAKRAIDRAYEI